MQEKKIFRLLSSMMLALLLSIIMFSIHTFSSLVAAYAETIYMNNSYVLGIHDNILTITDNSLLGNLAKQFGGLTKQFEYTVNLDGKQIFPNDTIKQDIVTKYTSTDYNINSLNYKILGFNINASNIKIRVNPSRIDQSTTRVDFPVLLARNVTVTNGSINLKYRQVNLGSIYGIYNKDTDKMTVHIPISTALQYLPNF
jgi:hypothetical protein